MSEQTPSRPGGRPHGTARPAPPDRPGTVGTAVSLMLLGAVLQVGYTAVVVAAMPRVMAVVLDEVNRRGYLFDPDDLRPTAGDYAGQIVFGAAVALVWVWMARTNGQGRGWARTVATVLTVLNVLSFVVGLAGLALVWSALGPIPDSSSFLRGPVVAMIVLAILLAVAHLVIALAVTVLLWRRSSSDYIRFAQARRPRRDIAVRG